MRRTLMAALALGFLIAAGDALAGGGYRDPENCASAVERRLRQAGLAMSDLQSQRWQRDETRSQGEVNVWGYWFYARPRSCTSGDIRITLSTTCGVRAAEARGGCEVAGFR